MFSFKRMLPVAVLGLAMGLGAAGGTLAANNGVTLSGGIGISSLWANEFVYSGGNKLSQLVWKSSLVPTASAAVDVPLSQGWHLRLSGEAGIGGDGDMTDFDWIPPYATGTGPNNWSDRSHSPDTGLDHYLSARASVRRDLYHSGGLTAGLHGSLGYTDVKWTAYGGSFIYSTSAFRDTTGSFAAGAPVVSYRQEIPTVMVGPNMHYTSGRWLLSARAEAGISFLAADGDDHWLRALHFDDYMNPAPAVAAAARVNYAFSTRAHIFGSLSAQKVYNMKGYEVITDTTNGNQGTTGQGTVGMDFASVSLTGGLSGNF